MLLLTSTTHLLELDTSSSSAIDVSASYVDITTSAFSPGSQDTAITTATTTTIVSAPSGSTNRQIKMLSIKNKGTAKNNITLIKDVSGTEYTVFKCDLFPNELVQYVDGVGFTVFDSAGNVKTVDAATFGNSQHSIGYFKVGTAAEAAATWYCWSKDSGVPGAWSPGSPGVNGRATDGTASADSGCFPVNNATGANYITFSNYTGTATHQAWLFDVLWVNTGLVVTTTTAQAITPVAIPSRDANGGTAGVGVWAGILVTAATTNAAAITNTTMSYTNSDGVAGRTATMASFPATAVIGTVVWFQLQAGDKGVQSVQSVTLGTSYAGGSISLILAVPIISQAVLTANVGTTYQYSDPGVRIYNGACLLNFGYMPAATATTITGTIQVVDR